MEKNVIHETRDAELMTYEQLSDYLGRSVNTLRQDVQYRRVPFLKIGRLIRFRKIDIDNWLSTKVIQCV